MIVMARRMMRVLMAMMMVVMRICATRAAIRFLGSQRLVIEPAGDVGDLVGAVPQAAIEQIDGIGDAVRQR